MTLFKQILIQVLRKTQLLPAADALKFCWLYAAYFRKNRIFREQHTDFPVPPAMLAYDAYGYIDWALYRDSGIRHARILADIIRVFFVERPVRVLEWGCGPGRILRQLGAFLPMRHVLAGADINRRSITWCRRHLPGIAFSVNEIAPPLPFERAAFDCIIARSVFTHLSESMHRQWLDELIRCLAPDGLLIVTTQGDLFKQLFLSPAEQQAYDNGDMVVRKGTREGRKWYNAFHPAPYMRLVLFRDLNILRHLPGPVAEYFEQDLWLVTPDRLKKPEMLRSWK